MALTYQRRVRIPRVVRRLKEELSREDIIRILEACTSIKLKTFCLTLVSTGLRAAECCPIRIADIDFKKCKIAIRGEFTKTQRDHYIFMTSELKDILQQWLDHKYGTRIYYSKEDHKNIKLTPTSDNC
jgi:integrase